MQRSYFDHNATTPVDPEVLGAMLPWFSEKFGNAGSIHSFGQQARAAVEQAREQVARLVGASAAEIAFTSGGTESNNMVILGIVRASRTASKHIITTAIEHSAVLRPCQALEKSGIEVTYLPVDSRGVVDPDAVRRALRPDTLLISVMMANNELGSVQPIEEIGRIAEEADVWFHTDAVQAGGKLPIDVARLLVDFLALSGHKFYAPKGVGALYVRAGARIEPLLYGGRHSRDGRPGTENVPGIVGLGKAAELSLAKLPAESARLAALRDRFERGVLERVPEVQVNGAGAARVVNTSNITFSYIEGESLVIALDLKGVACSTGAACSSGAVAPSHVLSAIGREPAEARASLRFSFGRANTEAEVDRALEILPSVVEHLRELSPLYKKPVAIS